MNNYEEINRHTFYVRSQAGFNKVLKAWHSVNIDDKYCDWRDVNGFPTYYPVVVILSTRYIGGCCPAFDCQTIDPNIYQSFLRSQLKILDDAIIEYENDKKQ